jgi:hypothetical protein
MSEEQKKELFIELCLSKKDRLVLSEPLNTKLDELYRVFKIGLSL